MFSHKDDYNAWLKRDGHIVDDVQVAWERGPLERLYPATGIGDNANLPQTIIQGFREAHKLQSSSPRASIVLARSTLEAICADQGIKGKDLAEKVGKLMKSPCFPPIMDATIVDRIRVLGNNAAHKLDREATPADAELIIELTGAIIRYVYEAPALVQRVRDQITAQSNTGNLSAHP